MKEKKCQVDRGKVLINLECCRWGRCTDCTYYKHEEFGCQKQSEDTMAYIGWLEEQLKERGYDVLG